MWRSVDAGRHHAPLLLAAGVVVLVCAIAWLLYLDATWGYVPTGDSATYLEAASQLAAGHGVVTLVGNPIGPSTAHLVPFYFHPPGSLLPYAPAGADHGPEQIASALSISLLIYLATVSLVFVAALRLTGHLGLAAIVATAFGLDPLLLSQVTGILTTAPFTLLTAALIVLVIRLWPVRPRTAAIVGLMLAALHGVRMAELPLAVVAVLVALRDAGWRTAGILGGSYVLGSFALAPLIPPSPAVTAILVAGTPGYEGFSPAQLDPPSLGDIFLRHSVAIARKVAANVVEDVRVLPSSVNAFLVIPGLAIAAAAAVRGNRLALLLVGAVAASIAFSAAAVSGTQYVSHLLAGIYLAVAVALAAQHSRGLAPLSVLAIAMTLAVTGHDVRDLYRARSGAEELAAAYLRSAAIVREMVPIDATIISDTPSVYALYAERRTFAIPLRVADLQRLAERIGGADWLILTRRQTDDVIGYPDDRWRAAFRSEDVDGLRLVTRVGSGRSEVRIYRRSE